MKIITAAEFDERWEASRKQEEIVYDTNGFDLVERCQNEWGDATYKEVELQSELHLVLFDKVNQRDYNRIVGK